MSIVTELFPVAELKCRICQKMKDISLFPKDRTRKHGLRPECKECHRPKQAKWLREYRKNNLAKMRESYRWHTRKCVYGLSKEQYFEILAHQGGACAICKKTPEGDIANKLRVDHNHKTGEVRGLLCHSCNVAIGNLKDSITIISNALQYLRERGSYGA